MNKEILYGLWSPYTKRFMWGIEGQSKRDVFALVRKERGIASHRLVQLGYCVKEKGESDAKT